MSDKKEKQRIIDDNERANELMSIFKKYWKIDDDASVSPNGSNTDNNNDTEESSELPEYDGIISEQLTEDEAEKRKKKYSGIPDDEPLFIFDSFEADDDEIAADEVENDEPAEPISAVSVDTNDTAAINNADAAEEIDDAVNADDTDISEILNEIDSYDIDDGINGDFGDDLNNEIEVENIVNVEESIEEAQESETKFEEFDDSDNFEDFEDFEDEFEYIEDINDTENIEKDSDGIDEYEIEEIEEDTEYDESDTDEPFESKKGEQLKFTDYYAELDEYDDDDFTSDEGISVIKLNKNEINNYSSPHDIGGESHYTGKRLHGLFPSKKVQKPIEDTTAVKQPSSQLEDIGDETENSSVNLPSAPTADISVPSSLNEEDEVVEVAESFEYITQEKAVEETDEPENIGKNFEENIESNIENNIQDDLENNPNDTLDTYESAEITASLTSEKDSDDDGNKSDTESVTQISSDAIQKISNDENEAPELAEELEEAVSFAESYEELSDDRTEIGKGAADEADEPPILAEEVDELFLAEEIGSTVTEQQAQSVALEENDRSKAISELAAEEAFLRECAQFELPKLSMRSRPISESEDDEIDHYISSGYTYEETEGYDHSLENESDNDTEKQKERRIKKITDYRSKLADANREILYCAVISCILLLLENFKLFFGNAEISQTASIMLFGFDALLSAICVFITRDMLSDILHDIKKSFWHIEAVGAFASVLVLIYDAIAFIIFAINKTDEKELLPLGFCAAVCNLISAVIRRIKLSEERKSFEIATAAGDIYSSAELEKNPAIPEYREFAGMISNNAPIFCVSRALRSELAYREERNGKRFRRFFFTAFGILALASAAIGIWSYFSNGANAYESVYLAFSLLLTSLPCSIGTAEISSRGTLTSRCASDNSAISGAYPAERFKHGSVVILRDTDIFPSHCVNVSNCDMTIEDKDNSASVASLERSLYRISSLFDKLGGTLNGVINMAQSEHKLSGDVIITDISEKGVSALVEGVYVRIGSAAYLGKYGIPVIADTAEYANNQRLLYVSDNGVFITKLLLTYKADAELCKRIRRLRKYGVAISVKTYDPCIDPALILACAKAEPELVKVIRYNTSDDRNFDRQQREGDIVSHSGACGLFTSLLAAIKYARADLPLAILVSLASLGGFALTLCGSLLNFSILQGALFIGIYHVICSFIAFIAAKLK